MKYFVIGDEITVLGFAMAGIDGRAIINKEEAGEVLDEIIKKKDIGIIIITERIAKSIKEKIVEYTYSLSFPLIIKIPDRFGPLPDRASIQEIIKSSVGITI